MYNKVMMRGLFLFISLLLICSPSARANEYLRFKEAETRNEIRAIEFIAQQKNQQLHAYKIAPIDLNDDFIDEYIVTLNNPQKCNKNNLCLYYFVALSDHKPINIGQFDAHKILISSKKSYGIHDIIVYNDAYNDFKNIKARWNPFNFSYQAY